MQEGPNIIMTIMASIKSFMRSAAGCDLWDMLNFFWVVLVSVVGAIYIGWAKRRVPHLNFYIQQTRDNGPYPFKIHIEIRNYTGQSVVFTRPYFLLRALRPDPEGRRDFSSNEMEVKFPEPTMCRLEEVEYLLRHKENVSTWVPIDPSHSDAEVEEAIRRRCVGTFFCICTWLQDKPKIHKLRYSF